MRAIKIQLKRNSPQLALAALLFTSILAYFLEAFKSLQIGGITFDEHIEAWGLIDTLRHGARILSGQASDFNDIVENLEFYGIVNKLPGLLTWAQMSPGRLDRILSEEDAFTLLGDMGKSGYYHYSHISSIIFFILTLAVVALASKKCKLRNYLAPTLLCLWWPSFAGHSLMNVKDVPFAFFYTLYSLSLILRAKHTPGAKGLIKTAFSAASAACLISIKFPSFAPICITEIAFSLLLYARAFLPNKHITSQTARTGTQYLKILSKCTLPFALITPIFAYVITPASWRNPLSYMRSSFELHTNHYWGGCTWLNGECIGKAVDPQGWNSLAYIASWVGAQIPALIILLLFLGVIALSHYSFKTRPSRRDLITDISRNPAIIIISLQAFLLPTLAAANNSTLYGALRHFTFSIPAISILCIFGCERFISFFPSTRGFIIGLTALLSIMLTIDNILMAPYQYAYLNEFSRNRVDLSKTELDYWGFSSGELMRKVAAKEPDKYGLVIGYRPMISAYLDILGRKDVPGGPRFNAHFTVDNLLKDSSHCRDIAAVRRRLVGSDEILLSKAYVCEE